MALKNAYDDDKIPLKAKVTGAPLAVNKIKQAIFKITLDKEGTESTEAPITVPVAGGFPNAVATHEFVLKPVDDGSDYYDLKYKAEITPPAKSAILVDGEDDFRVWPAKPSITFAADDGKAHKKVRFRLVRAGKDSAVKTAGDDGKWSESVGQNAWEIKVESPWELEGAPVTHKGKVRTYKVKKNPYKVEFISPKPADPTLTTKQYVNLDVDPNGWSENKPFGRTMSFTVGAVGDTARTGEARLGKQDDLVYIEVNFTPQTKRNDPRPQVVAAGLDGAPVAANTDKKWTGKIKLGANGQATFSVDLGFAGGDVCEVKVGADNTCADATLKFENWRRLFYEVMYADIMIPSLQDVGGGKHDLAKGITDLVTSRLADVFIEYQRKASHKYTKAQAGAGTIVSGDYIDQPGREVVILGGDLPRADPVAFNAPDNLTVQMKVADRTFSTNTTDDLQNLEADKLENEFSKPGKFFARASVVLAGEQWRAKIATPANYLTNPTAVFTTADVPDAVNKAYVITVEETKQKKSIELTFVRDGKGEAALTLEVGESSKIDPFMDSLLAVADLRRFANELQLKISRPTGSANHTTRETLVRNAVEASFNTKKQPIYAHPGLLEDGTPRSGLVDAAWFKSFKYDKIKVVLPVSSPVDHSMPGDFVGVESATKCPVTVNFTIKWGGIINGNSGQGKQLFQFRPAPRTSGAMASTLCHELAHSMGMTILAGRSGVAPGMDPALHVDNGGDYYRNSTVNGPGLRNIGVGGHCADGVPSKVWPKFNGGSGTCILFHEGGDADTRGAYCATCKLHLKARRLTNIIRAGWVNLVPANEY